MKKQMSWQIKLYNFLKEEKNKLIILLIFTLCYLTIFTIHAIIKQNYEFIFYTIFMLAVIYFIRIYYHELRLTTPILILLSFQGALHLMGGNIYISGVRLYDTYIYPKFFRYDNFIHIIGSFNAAIISYNFLRPYIENAKIKNKTVTLIIIVLIALGFGVINEILELFAVVCFDASNQVGDYMNNALDLLFNLIGAAIAAFYIRTYLIQKEKSENK